MNFKNISAWSIRNPIPPLVIFAGLAIAGLVSFFMMGVQNDPDIDFPGALVIIAQPGAAPTELESQVTERVEAAVRTIEGIDELNSTVTEGQSETFVQFAIGTPIDRAVNDIRDKLSQIRGNLPDGILEPQVIRLSTSGNTLAYWSASATDMTLEELSWYVDNTVSKRLLSVSGMGDVYRRGGVSREIRVILRPERMRAHGLTAAAVNAQLVQLNLNAAGGRMKVAGAEQAVRILGNASNALALGETQISIGNGLTVKLSDIADVKDAYAEQRSISKESGRQVLTFGFERAKGASDVTVYDSAVAELRKLERENPKVHFQELFSDIDYTKGQYHSAINAMVEGAILAVVVVFLFLRDWRATLISALAIPLSAIPTFWFMDLMGFSLNAMTLLALSLVAGVLVDDAIVEIENIVRHMRMGKSAYQASIDAADEIGLAVLATTMTIVAVFLPVALMPGIAGQYFKNFGMTVVAAVLMSLAVARTITPMLAAYFLVAHGERKHGEGRLLDGYMRLLHWSLDTSAADAMRIKGKGRWGRAYLKDHRIWVVGLGALAFIATIFTFSLLPTTFQPAINSDTSRIAIQLVPGATLEQTEAITDRVAAIMEKDPLVETTLSRIEVGSATIFLRLKKDRVLTSTEFERDRAQKLMQIPDARINFQSQFGGGGGSSRDISITLGSDDPVKLEETGARLLREMAKVPEIRAPRVEGNLQRPEIVIRPRFALAAQLGVTTQALSQTIRVATLGEIDQNSPKFSLSDRQIPVRVVLAEASRERLDTLSNMPVPTRSGGSVPLSVVADIGFGAGPTQINRTNQVRQLTIGADLAPGLVSGQAMTKIEALPTLKQLPSGVTRLVLGSAKWQAELLKNFLIAVASGIFLVLAVLILLYRKVIPPFVNLGSLLLAPLGGGLALLVTGSPLSLPVFIGVLMLLGIVGKNSILLVDFALEEMAKGVARKDAVIDAGHKRAQPILMTTVAMVAGMIPTALSLTGDGALRAPMAITVIGGLILSTALTLLIVPATFSLAAGMEQSIGPRLRRRFTNGDSEAGS
jgi:multidrug efflux pump subunit AcrB